MMFAVAAAGEQKGGIGHRLPAPVSSSASWVKAKIQGRLARAPASANRSPTANLMNASVH
jgi:hypothetical protein